MRSAELGLIVAIGGLGMWLAFTQTARHLAIGPIAKLLAALIIPIAVAAVWRIALDLGWWTILLFIAASLIVGATHGIAMRKIGKEGVYSMQTSVGIIGVILVLVSWLLK